MHPLPAAFLAMATLVLAAARAIAADWPEFRGPTGQGTAAVRELPLEWSAAKNVAWKTAIPGKGWSSPVLKGGAVFLTTATEPDGGAKDSRPSLRALCLDQAKGTVRWDVEVFPPDAAAPGIHRKNTHASPTPVAAEDRLYVHFGHQGTACLDLAGQVLWRNRDCRYPPVHGSGGSPALCRGLLVFSADGASDPFVAALDARTGVVRWKTPRSVSAAKTFSFSTPLVIAVRGEDQIVIPGSNAVYAYEPASGKEIWRVRYEGYSVVPRPVFGHGLVFISTGFDEPRVLAIRPDGEGDVTSTHVAWSLRKGAPNTPSLLLVGDELYSFSDGGVGICVEAKSGSVHWQKRVCGGISASPVFAAGRVYLQDEDGLGVVLKSGKTFEKLAENTLGERTLASYAVAEGAVYIRGDQHLFKIGS